MLYELIGVVRTGNVNYVKDIARTTSLSILQNTGTIRRLTNLGSFSLPKPTTKHQTQHHRGHYFVLTFDSSVGVQNEIRRQLSLNPHMIRYSIVKVGDKLGGKRNQRLKIEGVTGEVEWNDWVKAREAPTGESGGLGSGFGVRRGDGVLGDAPSYAKGWGSAARKGTKIG